MGMTNIVLDDEEIQLFDDNAPMEEVNMDDVHYPIHNVHNDQFFNDNDELLDEDIELNDLDEELDDSNNDLDTQMMSAYEWIYVSLFNSTDIVFSYVIAYESIFYIS